jgi:cell division septal protein FtsQ
LSFVPIFLIVVAIAYVTQEKVRAVECELAQAPCSAEIQIALTTLAGKKLFLSDFVAESAYVLQSDPSVQVESVTKHWPATVKIKLQPSQPVYKAYLGAEEVLLATDTGYLITKDDISAVEIPKVYINTASVPDKTLMPQLLHDRLKLLIHSLAAEKISYQEIEVQTEDRALLILESKIALVTLDAPAYDIKRLSLVLKGLEPDKLETVREIDLRYKFPVLRNVPTVSRQKTQ